MSEFKNVERDLIIRGESIQKVYDFFIKEKLVVNRRYQRKLVWTVLEKEAFIDSIMKGFPIPLILFAEKQDKEDKKYEIIDGMQRLDAITSFIEGQFSLNGNFFDLKAMASSKLLLDNGKLTQKIPVLTQEESVCIANYSLPISTYQETSVENIDEIFRRINSNGRKLSNQELRQAGALGVFSELVRNLSSKIRGDVSTKDTLLLNEMKKISLSSSIEKEELNYGIDIDKIFWIKDGIIRKTQVRDSKDEEIVADILASIIMPTMQGASNSILDNLYSKSSKRSEEMEEELGKINIDLLKENFIKIYDEINKILQMSENTFVKLLFSSTKDKVSRYYIVLFLSFYDLIIKENFEVDNYSGLIKTLNNLYDKKMTLSQGGGTWSAKEKTDSVDITKGHIVRYFKKSSTKTNPAYDNWKTEFENILMLSRTEQVLYDFKQGFINLQTKKMDTNNFKKIMKTLTAIANVGKNKIGYVLIGISDNSKDSAFFEKTFEEKNIKFNEFHINGIEKEAELISKDLDSYYTTIIQLIKAEDIAQVFKDSILKNIKLVTYNNKHILVFKIVSQEEPILYDGAYYRREGSNTSKIEMSHISSFFKNFNN